MHPTLRNDPKQSIINQQSPHSLTITRGLSHSQRLQEQLKYKHQQFDPIIPQDRDIEGPNDNKHEDRALILKTQTEKHHRGAGKITGQVRPHL